MMYFTFQETLTAFLTFLAFGFLSGAVYECLRCFFTDIGLLLSVVLAAWKSALLRDKDMREKIFVRAAEKELPPVRREICGFIFTVLFGVCFLLLNYLLLDGSFRLYLLFGAIISLSLFEKLLGIPSRRWIRAGFSRILRVLYFLLRIFFFPLRFLLRFFAKRLLDPLLSCIRAAALSLENRMAVKRTLAKWKASLNLYK